MWLEANKEHGAGLQQYLESGSIRVSTEGQLGSVGGGERDEAFGAGVRPRQQCRLVHNRRREMG